MGDRRLWTEEEDFIIVNLVESYGCGNWTQIAQEMKKSHPQLSRSSKQIRERWYNHLDPSINKLPWSQEEENIIFDAHQRWGSKWKDIAGLLHARTDNSVKNHFYSTLRRSLRRINKFLGFKNSTNQMRMIKPSILCQLIKQSQKCFESRCLVNGIFQFSKYKPNKINQNCQNEGPGTLSIQQRNEYERQLQKLIEFNAKYDRNCEKIHQNSRKVSKNRVKKETLVWDDEMELTSKGHESLMIEGKLQRFQDEDNIVERNQMKWEECGQDFFGDVLPDLEKPDQEQDLLIKVEEPEFFP